MKPQPLIILLDIFRLSLEPIQGMEFPNLASCHLFILFYYRQIALEEMTPWEGAGERRKLRS